jgi:propanol-preferring alcohol dehydrogenase
MKAMILKNLSEIKVEGRKRQREDLPIEVEPLKLADIPVPIPGEKDILIKIAACGVCHTELDQIEGRIFPPKLPVVPGHQPVGIVEKTGVKAHKFKAGDRVGAAWIFSSCGQCKFCKNGSENLCDRFKATGSHADGGYAEYMTISEDYAYKIPDRFVDLATAAPLMCSGVIGYRSLKLSGMEDGKILGLYGFGGSNHLVIQMANYMFPNSKKYVISRNVFERELAQKLGADWSGDIDTDTPEKMDCVIDTTPVWKPVIRAMENLEKGGRLVLNLIRKEDADKDFLMQLNYPQHLWLEKEIKTVANVTRVDAEEFLSLAGKANITPEMQEFRLEEANKALVELKSGKIRGSKVLRIG